jgi:hypothetical protein
MKLVKNFAFVMLLVSALSVNALGGDQQTPGFTPPPPPSNSMIIDPNEVPNDGTSTGENGATVAETSDYLFYEAFTALLSLY